MLELSTTGTVICTDVDQSVFAYEIQTNDPARKQSLTTFQDLVEDRRGVANRLADDAEHFRRRLLLLQRLADLIEETYVLHSDHCLRRERPEQGDLLVRKRTHVSPAYDHGTQEVR